jgi:hypothetical protein
MARDAGEDPTDHAATLRNLEAMEIAIDEMREHIADSQGGPE